MKNIRISIEKDTEVYRFEITDYVHHEHSRCKFEVFLNGMFVAGFEPDNHEYLRVCKNTGTVDEEVLHLIADKLEATNV